MDKNNQNYNLQNEALQLRKLSNQELFRVLSSFLSERISHNFRSKFDALSYDLLLFGHILFLFFWTFLFIYLSCLVWGCLGPHKHSIGNLREHQGSNWSWGGSNFCKASWVSEWWCSWAGKETFVYSTLLKKTISWLNLKPFWNCRLCGHWEMLLVILLDVVILSSAMERWFH